MKTYRKDFVKKLFEYYAAMSEKPKSLDDFINNSEKKFYYDFINEFPYPELVNLICSMMNIQPSEYYSRFKNGNLAKSRQIAIYILYLLGAKNSQISKITGFKPSIISHSVKKVDNKQSLMDIVESVLTKLKEK